MNVEFGRWQLPQRLIALSEGTTWSKSIREWRLIDVEMLDPGEDNEHCLCGHAIREVCHVANKINANTAIIGNCCITKFEHDTDDLAGTHKIFQGLKRIKTSSTNAANIELIRLAYQKGIITEADKSFYEDSWRKRTLSEKQSDWRESINDKILIGLRKSAMTSRQALTELRQDITSSPNLRLIDLAKKRAIIKEKDAEFLSQIWTRSHATLSDGQKRYKLSLNNRIVSQLTLPPSPAAAAAASSAASSSSSALPAHDEEDDDTTLSNE